MNSARSLSRPMTLVLLALMGMGPFLPCPIATAETLEKSISREHPLFDGTGMRLTVGMDGKVYVFSSGGYVIRMNADGTGRISGKVPLAVKNIAVDPSGTIAVANAFMSASVNVYDSRFRAIGKLREFLATDKLGWGDPSDIQVCPSGDFYAVDQNRNRIVRIKSPGQVVTTYSIEALGEDWTKMPPRMRMSESLERFYISTVGGKIHAISFAGKKLWTVDTPEMGGRFPCDGEFDADEQGNLYLLPRHTDTIKVIGPDGQPKDPIQLKMGDLKGIYTTLVVTKDEIFVKRTHPTELFQVYDRKTGELKRVVQAEAESIKVEFPSTVWTAGQSFPITISHRLADKVTTPNWPVRIALYNDSQWNTLPVVDGKITPPADASGLYMIRVGFGQTRLQKSEGSTSVWLLPDAGTCRVEKVVEIRIPGSRGTVSIMTPRNRVYYGRGESIPVTMIVRGGDAGLSAKLTLSLNDRKTGAEVMRFSPADITWKDNVGSVSISQVQSAKLLPGRYMLSTNVDSMTVAPQPLVVGPGLRERPLFNIIQGGDMGVMLPDGLHEAPIEVASHVEKLSRIGANMVMDRVGGTLGFNPPAEAQAVKAQLSKDPLGIAPEKADVEHVILQAVAARGAFGIEEQAILFSMDGMIPALNPDEPNESSMTPKGYMADWQKNVKKISTDLLPYAAFRGWSWACNWWMDRELAMKHANLDKKAWKKLKEKVIETGQWDPEVERYSDSWVPLNGETDKGLNAALQEVAPGKINSVPGPYRQPGVIPTLSFGNAGEIDLWVQAEQVQMAFMTPHNVDFYKRPGKRAFGHVEMQNDEGTGLMALPIILLQAARGADGTGWEGGLPTWRTARDDDSRSAGQGIVSNYRALCTMLRRYGPWLTTLQGNDKIAIVVSTRMMRLDDWEGHLGGRHFERLFEAYTACSFAHRPASFVFTEEATAETLKKFKAILVVDQRVELDPQLAQALAEVRKANVPVFYDGTCREEWVKGFEPLNVTFDRVEKEVSVMNCDASYYTMPKSLKEHAAGLIKALGAIVPEVATLDNPEVVLSERVNGEGRFVWAVNNDLMDIEPCYMWRVGNYISNRMPRTYPIDLHAGSDTVYEIFGMNAVKNPAADFRTMPARLFAILPRPIEALNLAAPAKLNPGDELSWSVTINGPRISYPLQVRLMDADGTLIEEAFPTKTAGRMIVPVNTGPIVTLEAVELISGKKDVRRIEVGPAKAAQLHEPQQVIPVEKLFGPHLRDAAVSLDGSTALVNALNWDDNFYMVNTHDGKVISQGRIGHHFAYGPVASAKGFFLQGYDFATAEGYHLYQMGTDGKSQRRFAIYGVPQRAIKWIGGPKPEDRMNNFVVSPDGTWIADAGSLGLVVWSNEGKKLWSLDCWKNNIRQQMFLLAQDNNTLITISGLGAAAYEATTGKNLWEIELTQTGRMMGGAASKDGHTVAVYSDAEGGRTFILRDGKVISTLFFFPDSIAVTPDGRHVAIVLGRELRWLTADGLGEWTFQGDSYLHMMRISPDGKKVVFGSDVGTLYMLDENGQKLLERDFGAWPVATWLPGDELLVTTWMGNVARLGADGSEKWNIRVESKGLSRLDSPTVPDNVPTTRMTWSNALEEHEPLTDNLLVEAKATITMADDRLPVLKWHKPDSKEFTAKLTDGKVDPPAEGWLRWHDVGMDMSGWTGKNVLQIETPGPSMRVESITFVEDPKHPESWLRDMVMQAWDPAKGVWVDCPYLVSDSAIHTHRLEKPITAPKFRFYGGYGSIKPLINGSGWPAGNIRLGEIVFHGQMVPEASE